VADAGAQLREAVAASEQLSKEERRGEANINLAKASLALAQACSTLYGDGPW
jgi:hypothetical protein